MIQTLLAELTQVAPLNTHLLNPPLSQEQIKDYNNQLSPFCLTQELQTLYGWHNGKIELTSENFNMLTDFSHEFNLFFEQWYSIDEALDWRNKYLDGLQKDDFYFPKAWLPIGTIDVLEYVAVLGRTPNMPTKILSIDPTEGDFTGYLVFESVEALLRTHLEYHKLQHQGLDPDYNDFILKYSPNSHRGQSDGIYSTNNVQNVFDLWTPEDLPKEWWG